MGVNKKTAVNDLNLPWYCSEFDLYIKDYKPCEGKIGKGECKNCKSGPEAVNTMELKEDNIKSDYIPKEEAEKIITDLEKENFVEPRLEEGHKTRCYFNPKQGVWFIKYRGLGGEIINHSTGTDDRAKAIKLQNKIRDGFLSEGNKGFFCEECGKEKFSPTSGLCRDCCIKKGEDKKEKVIFKSKNNIPKHKEINEESTIKTCVCGGDLLTEKQKQEQVCGLCDSIFPETEKVDKLDYFESAQEFEKEEKETDCDFYTKEKKEFLDKLITETKIQAEKLEKQGREMILKSYYLFASVEFLSDAFSNYETVQGREGKISNICDMSGPDCMRCKVDCRFQGKKMKDGRIVDA